MIGYKKPRPGHQIDWVEIESVDHRGNGLGDRHMAVCFANIDRSVGDWLLEGTTPAAIRFYPQWTHVSKECAESFYYDLMARHFFFGKCVVNMDTIFRDEYIDVSLKDSPGYSLFELLSTLIMVRYPDEGFPIVQKWFENRDKKNSKADWLQFYKAHNNLGYVNSNHCLFADTWGCPSYQNLSPNRTPQFDTPGILANMDRFEDTLISSYWRT